MQVEAKMPEEIVTFRQSWVKAALLA